MANFDLTNYLPRNLAALDVDADTAWPRWSSADRERFLLALQQEIVRALITGKVAGGRVWTSTKSSPQRYLDVAALVTDVKRDHLRIQELLPYFRGEATWKERVDYVIAQPGRMGSQARKILNPDGPAIPQKGLTGAARRRAAATLPEVIAWREGYREMQMLALQYGIERLISRFAVPGKLPVPTVPDPGVALYVYERPKSRDSRIPDSQDDIVATPAQLAASYAAMLEVPTPPGQRTRSYGATSSGSSGSSGSGGSMVRDPKDPEAEDPEDGDGSAGGEGNADLQLTEGPSVGLVLGIGTGILLLALLLVGLAIVLTRRNGG